MLPPHLEECPRCGQNLSAPAVDLSFRDIFRITGVVVLIAAVPFVLMIVVGGICLLSMR